MIIWRFNQPIERLGKRYRLKGVLGGGGMADVCLAWDERAERDVAIKLMRPGEMDSEKLNRFLTEASVVARWRHPNIVRVYGNARFEVLDKAQGSVVPYIVMEYITGGDLQHRLKPGQPLPLDQLLPIFAQLCSAVAFAHEQKVIHRDLKPSNILFRRLPGGDEQVVLSDFGLVVDVNATHFTFAGGGTLHYMAPEQFRGRVQQVSDIFALGVILYQLSTGQLPFRRSLQDLQRAGSGTEALPPSPRRFNSALPEGLDEVFEITLAEDPRARFATASDLWRAVYRAFVADPAFSYLLADLGGTTSPASLSAPVAPLLEPIGSVADTSLSELDLVDDGEVSAPSAFASSARSVERSRNRQVQPVEDLPDEADGDIIDILDAPLTSSTGEEDLQSQSSPPTRSRSHYHLFELNDPNFQPPKSKNGPDTDANRANASRSQTGSAIPPRSSRSIANSDPAPLIFPIGPTTSAHADYSQAATTRTGRQPAVSRPTRPTGRSTSPAVTTVTPQGRRTAKPVRRSIWLIALVLVFFLIGAVVLTTQPQLLARLTGTAATNTTITITPDRKLISDTYLATAWSDINQPDVNQRSVHLNSIQPAASTKTIAVTGTGHTQTTGAAAQGTLLLNNSAPKDFPMAKGTTFVATSGVTIATDDPVTIPAGNPSIQKFGETTVHAHAVEVGKKGNIVANDVFQNCCTADGTVGVKNQQPFSGGTDPQNYNFITQDDVNRVTNDSKNTVLQSARDAVNQVLKQGEQIVGDINCGDGAKVTTDQKTGDNGPGSATSTNATISATCTAIAINPNDITRIGSEALKNSQAVKTLNNAYTQVGNIVVSNPVINSVSADHKSATLQVAAAGVWAYQLSPQDKTRLARELAGKSKDAAQSLLKNQTGVKQSSITLNDGGAILPTDPQQITIQIQTVSGARDSDLPQLQGTPVSTGGGNGGNGGQSLQPHLPKA